MQGDHEAKLLSPVRAVTSFWGCGPAKLIEEDDIFPHSTKQGNLGKCGERIHALRSGLWRRVDGMCERGVGLLKGVSITERGVGLLKGSDY